MKRNVRDFHGSPAMWTATILVLCAVALPGCEAPPPSAAAEFVELQGHRGARGLLPENTIDGFIRALDLGADTVELDVVVSGDSQVVVSHEPWFSSSICSKPDGSPVEEEDEESLNIHAMTYAEIARYDCGSRGNALFPQQEMRAAAKPLLRDAIDAVEAWGEQHSRQPNYNIEIKSRPSWDNVHQPVPDVMTRLVHQVIEAAGIKERVTVQSFDPRILEAMRGRDAALALSFLVDNDDGLETNLARLTFTPGTYSPNQRLVDAAMLAKTRQMGIRVVPWTVNNEEAMRTLIRLGVDGLITDYPDLGRRAIDEEQAAAAPQP